MRRLLSAAPAVLVSALLASAVAHAGTLYSYSMGTNSSVSYRLLCQNGQIISGETSAPTRDVACADSSNLFSWKSGTAADGSPWGDVQTDDRKTPAFRKHLRDSLQKLFDQNKLVIHNKLIVNGNVVQVQKSVLKVPQQQVAGPPRSLERLIQDGVITPADILYRRDYAGGPHNVDVVDTVDVGPGQSFASITFYGFAETSPVPDPPVPGIEPRSLVTMLVALGLVGAWFLTRRRRDLRAGGRAAPSA